MYEDIIEKAKEAMKNAYAPYSEFCVGAAIKTADGKIFSGCNVENASFGASICAERTAAVKAVSEGCRNFKEIAIVSSANTLTPPCGICRQFLSEFMDSDAVIVEYCINNNNPVIKTYILSEVFPDSFCLE